MASPPTRGRRFRAAGALLALTLIGCGLLPDAEPERDDRVASEIADADDSLPPAAPDGGEGGNDGSGAPTDVERIRDLEERIDSRLDARPRSMGSTATDALAEASVLVALAALVAFLTFAYRHHRLNLALALGVLGLVAGLAAFVNSAL